MMPFSKMDFDIAGKIIFIEFLPECDRNTTTRPMNLPNTLMQSNTYCNISKIKKAYTILDTKIYWGNLP